MKHLIFPLLLFISFISNAQSPSLVYPKNKQVLADTLIMFQWDELNGSDLYNLLVSNDSNFQFNLIDTTISSFSFQASLSHTISPYYVKLRAKSGFVYSNYSFTTKFFCLTPSNIDSIKVWFNADTLVVKDLSNNISSWQSIIGNNIIATQSVNTNKPLYTDTGFFSNKRAIYFDGNNRFLNINSNVTFSSTLVVFNYTGGSLFTNFNGLLATQGTSSSPYYFLIGNQASTNLYTAGGAHYVLSNIIINGVNKVSLSPLKDIHLFFANSNVSVSKNNLCIGRAIAIPARSWQGFVTDIVLFNKNLSFNEAYYVNKFFSDKYTPPLNIGSNILRRYSFCDTVLSTQAKYEHYLWSTGDTTRSISLGYQDTGWYWCQVPNLYGEQMRDSVYVYNFVPKQSTPVDTTVCYAVPLTLNSAFSASAHYNNLWKNSNGDTLSTSPSLTLVPFSPHPLVLTVSDSLGCSISDTIRIAIDSFALEASLGADKSLCSGDKIALESGNHKAISYLWSDNSTDSTLVVNTAGSYALRVSNARACIALDTVYAAIHGITPAVGFVADTVCFKTNSPFQDTSSSLDASNLIQWEWDFGDGNTLQQFNNSIVQHLYADSGTYVVKLRVSTDSNCANYTYKSVYVIPLPRPNFVPLQVCINEAISFSDLSQSSFSSISNYYWNFKDGNTSIDPQPVHSFTQTGTYDVSLLTITQNNCYDSIVKSVRVKPAPQAAIAVAPVCLGIPSYFSDISTNPGSNPLYQRRWYYGQNDSSTAHTASYTFATAGNHPLRLIVNSINGCSDTAEANAYVAVIPEANFKIMGLPCQHSNLSFIDSTQILPDSLEQFYWSMDGTLFSTWADATYYVFHDTLIHTLSYKVVSNYGCSDSISKSIKIHALPKVSFFADQYYGLPPLTVQFTNTTPDATAFLWNFGDGSPNSTLENPSHIYTGGLTYYPFLKAFNQYGCFSTNSVRINNYYAKIDAELSATLSEIQGDNISYSCVVVNKGVQPIKKIDFYASYQEGTELIETWSGYLEAGNSLQYTFNARSKINVMDEVHYYCIRAEVSGNQVDENAANDKLCKELQNNLWIGNPYPNPVRDVLTLDIVVVAAIEADFKFIDMLGNTLSSSSVHLSKGFNSITLPMVSSGTATSGKLLLHIRIGEKEETRELILVK